MKKLNHILHCNYFYVLLLGITLLYSAIFLLIPHNSKINPKQIKFQGIITDFKISGNLLTLELKEKEKLIGYYYFNTEEEKNIFVNTYKFGDTVLILGNITKPNNNTVPNQFNYRKYLEYRKIYYQINIDSIKKIKSNSDLLFDIKNKIYGYLNNFKCKDYLYTLLLGNKDYLDFNTKVIYQNLGISHLFAISGMHISLLGGILLLLFKKIKLPIFISYTATILFLLFYMILLDNNISVARAVMLFSILGMNKLFKLKIKTIHLLCIVFVILVVQNPYVLFEVGFQFSFTISFFLILLQNTFKNKAYFKNLLLVSTISTLVSLPISIYYFYQINLFSIILNLIFVPLVSFVIYPMCLISMIIKSDFVLKLLIDLMENLSYFFNRFSCLQIVFGKPNIYWIIVYYVFLVLFLHFKNKIGLVVIILLIITQYFNSTIFSKTFLTIIDVNQGDSLILHSNNKTILFDTGGKITYKVDEWKKRESKSLTEQTLIPVLKSYGIKKINYLILTHGDYDHMGEATNLVNNFKVDNVIFNNDSYNKIEIELKKVLEKKNIKYYKGLNKLNINNNKLYFLNTKNYDNENDNSNVLYFKLNNYKFLFMGDAGIEREKDMLNKYNLTDIDFLKIAHHGSDTSSSSYFIKKINPKNCLISVGRNNRYGHPKNSVLDILDNYCDIYRTDLNGSIEIKINKNNYEIKTYSP